MFKNLNNESDKVIHVGWGLLCAGLTDPSILGLWSLVLASVLYGPPLGGAGLHSTVFLDCYGC
jgi:hypothetical protein